MKKLTILIVLMMLLSLAACQKQPADTAADNRTPTTPTTATPPTGDSDGSVYQNTFFNIAFTPAAGWRLLNNEEITDRNMISLSIQEGES